MKKSDLKLTDNGIDLIEYVNILFKHKITILIFSAFGAIVASVYAFFFSSSMLMVDIIIKNPSYETFNPYNISYFYKSPNVNISTEFVSSLNDNLLSKNNLDNFRAKYISSSKKECINCNYFKITQNEKIKNIYVLTTYIKNTQKKNYYKEEYEQAIDFLNKYIVFTLDKNKKELAEKIYLNLVNSISEHEQALQIAKKMNIINPIATIQMQDQNIPFLFTKGITPLEFEITNLKTKANNILNEKFDYQHIFQKASVFSHEDKKFSMILLGLFSGFIFSCTIVLYRFAKI
jgi:LPS O-antigen subunit length determinant protein (WzzB/FepE family)